MYYDAAAADGLIEAVIVDIMLYFRDILPPDADTEGVWFPITSPQDELVGAAVRSQLPVDHAAALELGGNLALAYYQPVISR